MVKWEIVIKAQKDGGLGFGGLRARNLEMWPYWPNGDGDELRRKTPFGVKLL